MTREDLEKMLLKDNLEREMRIEEAKSVLAEKGSYDRKLIEYAE